MWQLKAESGTWAAHVKDKSKRVQAAAAAAAAATAAVGLDKRRMQIIDKCAR